MSSKILIDKENLIENYPNDYMVDFANEYIGGASLHGGCV